MARHLLYILLIITALVACEEVYNPNLDNVDNLLVVEAIFIADQDVNNVYLYETLNYNSETTTYPAVTGATVYLVDDQGDSQELEETSKGTYQFSGQLDSERSYYLSIEIGDDVYKSEIQTVPGSPELDSVYGGFVTQTTTSGAVNSDDDVTNTYGLQIYTDIDNEGEVNHYRFDGKKIIEFIDYYDTVIYGEETTMPIYEWKTYSTSGTFNIAGPPEYSAQKAIKKHELEFFKQNYYAYIADTQVFTGWIYVVDEYGISEDAYNYYSDLNSQLDAEGKIFDPVYVQVEGNISCTTDEDQTVLGYFEIESHKEYRYFIDYYRNEDIYSIREITDFYDIDNSGYIKDTPPDFWEN